MSNHGLLYALVSGMTGTYSDLYPESDLAANLATQRDHRTAASTRGCLSSPHNALIVA